MKSRSILPFVALLALTELITVALFLACLFVFHKNPFGLYVNFIISFGGMIFGLLGALGAYPGAKLSGLPPTTKLAWITAAATWLALLLYHWLVFDIAYMAGDLAARTSGFSGFVDSISGHAHFRMSPSQTSPSDIGRMGYGLLASDFAWSALGVWSVFGALRKVPHCRECKTYYRLRNKHAVRFSDGKDLERAVGNLPPSAQERADALMRLQQFRPVSAKKGTLQLSLKRSECPSCNEQSMVEEIKVHNGKGYVRVDGVSYNWRPTRASRIEPEQVGAPVARGFGRKGLPG